MTTYKFDVNVDENSIKGLEALRLGKSIDEEGEVVVADGGDSLYGVVKKLRDGAKSDPTSRKLANLIENDYVKEIDKMIYRIAPKTYQFNYGKKLKESTATLIKDIETQKATYDKILNMSELQKQELLVKKYKQDKQMMITLLQSEFPSMGEFDTIDTIDKIIPE